MKGRTIVGTVLIVLGAGLLLDRLGYIDFGSIVSTWWPSVLIAAGVLQLATRSAPAAGSILLVAVGSFLQAWRLDYLPTNWGEFVWPVALIAVGAWLVLTRWRGPSVRGSLVGDTVRRFVMFGGTEDRNRSTAFHGGSLTALFGGAKLDLRDATLPPEGATIEATTAFGGVEVIVPPEWKVVVEGTPVFGAVENKTAMPRDAPEPRPVLLVRGFAMFGGVEVHN